LSVFPLRSSESNQNAIKSKQRDPNQSTFPVSKTSIPPDFHPGKRQPFPESTRTGKPFLASRNRLREAFWQGCFWLWLPFPGAGLAASRNRSAHQKGLTILQMAPTCPGGSGTHPAPNA